MADNPSVPVIEGTSGELPFSRGILARSLVKSGLDPVTAYTIALDIQTHLDKPRYKKEELREFVIEVLEREYPAVIVESYKRGTGRTPATVVIKGGDRDVPFSKGLLARSLRVTAIDQHSAISIAQKIERNLVKQKVAEIRIDELRQLVCAELLRKQGEEAASRYMIWRDMVASDSPLIVLIGGPTGAGKSTLALELASRMEITQVVSTDTIREMLRTMFSEKLLPAVHKSSYLVGKQLRLPPGYETDEVLVGYHQQSLLVNVGVEAMIKRAIQENVDLIINGVHIIPGLIAREDFPEACIVEFDLTVSEREEHLQRFKRRQRFARKRPAATYVKNFENICKIRDYVIQCAKKDGVPVFDNVDTDLSVENALAHIFNAIQSSNICGRAKEEHAGETDDGQ